MQFARFYLKVLFEQAFILFDVSITFKLFSLCITVSQRLLYRTVAPFEFGQCSQPVEHRFHIGLFKFGCERFALFKIGAQLVHRF